MLVVEPRVVDAVWVAVERYVPERVEVFHPLGCHRPGIGDREVFEGILLRLVAGCSWDVAGRLGEGGETTLRTRCNDWNACGVFDWAVEEALAGHDRVVGIGLSEVSVGTSIHKAPCGGEGTGKSPVDRGQSGWKWSLSADRNGIPVGWAADGVDRSDQALLAPPCPPPTSAAGLRYRDPVPRPRLRRRPGDAGLRTLRRQRRVRPPKRPPGAARGQPKAVALGKRWTIERTNSWLSNYGQLRRSTDRNAKARLGQLALAITLTITAKLIKRANQWNPT